MNVGIKQTVETRGCCGRYVMWEGVAMETDSALHYWPLSSLAKKTNE
jgi:hypothetical protein